MGAPKLVGLQGSECSNQLRSQLRLLAGKNIALISACDASCTTIMQACVTERFPFILLHPETNEIRSSVLGSVALAHYEITNAVDAIVEFADYIICSPASELAAIATALGIPQQDIAGGDWSPVADFTRPPRHGFEDRKSLLDFLDAR